MSATAVRPAATRIHLAHRPVSLRRRLRRIAFSCLAILIGLWSVLPFVWQTLSSFQLDAALTSKTPVLLSAQMTWSHYRSIFGARDFQSYILNSVIVTFSATAVALVLAAACAYALTRLPLPGKGLVLGVSLALSMFPQISIVAPLYLVMIRFNLLDTYEGLAGVYVGLSMPLMIFVMYGHFRSIPLQMDEAASIDGASRLRTLFSIILPLAAPGVVTAGLLGFIANWNEVLLALSFTSSQQRQTIPVGIANFNGQYFIPWGDMAAASVVVTIPLVVLVLVFQRRLVAGITSGGIKE
jgi:multiple sugar transport system permease protein